MPRAAQKFRYGYVYIYIYMCLYIYTFMYQRCLMILAIHYVALHNVIIRVLVRGDHRDVYLNPTAVPRCWSICPCNFVVGQFSKTIRKHIR